MKFKIKNSKLKIAVFLLLAMFFPLASLEAQTAGVPGSPQLLYAPLPAGPLYSNQDAPAAAMVALVRNNWDLFKNGTYLGGNFDQFQEAMLLGWVPDTPEGYDRFMWYRVNQSQAFKSPEFLGWVTAWDWAWALSSGSANWTVDYAPTLWQSTINGRLASGMTQAEAAISTTVFNKFFSEYLTRFARPPTSPSVYTPAPVPTAPAPTVSYPAGCTSTSGFSTTTGQACSGISNLPPGCTSTSGFSVTTGASCSGAGVTYPAGCTSSYGFSTTTGKPCSGTSSPISQPVTYAPYVPTTSLISSRKFTIGDYVQTTGSASIRSEAGLSQRLLTTYPAGTRGTVIGGPVSSTGWWWQVHFSTLTGSILVGWADEANIGKADINAPLGTVGATVGGTGATGSTGGTGTLSINFSANPPTISAGAWSGITWNAIGASTCALSNSSASGSTIYANFGGMSVSPAQTTTYTLVCTGSGGTATKNVTITVAGTGTGTTPTTPTTPTACMPRPTSLAETPVGAIGMAVIGSPVESFTAKDLQYLPSSPSEWRFLGTRTETAVDPSFPGTVAVRYWNLYVQPSTGKFWRVLFLTWSAAGSGPASNPVSTNWRNLPYYIEVDEAARRAPGSLGTGQWDRQPILWDSSQLRNTAQYKLYMMAPETLIVKEGWRVDTLALIKSIEAGGSPVVQQLTNIVGEPPATWGQSESARIITDYEKQLPVGQSLCP